MVKQSGRRIWGDGSIFQIGSGTKAGQWCGQITTGYSDGGRRTVKTVFAASEKVCLARLNELKANLADGAPASDWKLDQWIEYWLSDICPQRLTGRTLYNYRQYMEHHVIPVIGHKRLDQLHPESIRAVHKAMRDKGLAESTVHQVHVILSRCLKVAEREGKIKRNPATRVDAPSNPPNPFPVLSVEDAQRVLRAATDARELARLTCALVLGLRQGEALALTWADVDLVRGTLSVNKAASEVPGQGLVLKDPKSRSGRRDIPLPPPVVAVMMAWKGCADESPLVFPGRRGGMSDVKADWKSWRDALARAGVHHVPLHGARGTAASLLLEMGVPERVIADILGHANVQVTQQHYLHSDAAQRGRALDGLADRLGIAPVAVTAG